MPRLVGVILAAGRSSRMEAPKPLLRDRAGRTFLAAQIDAFRRSGVDGPILVVTGSRPRTIARAAAESGATAIHNPRSSRGQWSSCRCGLRAALALHPSRILLGLADVPGPRPATLRALLRADAQVAVPIHRRKAGHPIALGATVAARLLADRHSPHLRAALAACGAPVTGVDVDDAEVVAEINTPAQYRRWLRRR